MRKQHPQTSYRKYAVLMGTIFENCDKKLNCYIIGCEIRNYGSLIIQQNEAS